jgi:hypothetical protein
MLRIVNHFCCGIKVPYTFINYNFCAALKLYPIENPELQLKVSIVTFLDGYRFYQSTICNGTTQILIKPSDTMPSKNLPYEIK